MRFKMPKAARGFAARENAFLEMDRATKVDAIGNARYDVDEGNMAPKRQTSAQHQSVRKAAAASVAKRRARANLRPSYGA